jgi:hypothetical protein
MKYDRVYYWVGGAEEGEWCAAIPGSTPWGNNKSADELREDIRRQGRVAHLGISWIGPPEGPPSHNQLKAVGFLD